MLKIEDQQVFMLNWCDIVRLDKACDGSPCTVYVNDNNKWVRLHHHVPQTHCRCSRAFKGFKFKGRIEYVPATREECEAWLKLPELCQVCYYAESIKRGEWAPKAVYQELGLEK